MQGMQFSYLHKVPHLCKQPPTVTPRVHLARAMATALRNETPEQRTARKEQIKAQKADKRARREGHVPDEYGQKQCSLCNQLKDLLIRCQIDKTEKWHMVCGKCWKKVSGGVVDGDDDHADYRYGGLWKNLHKADKLPDSLHESDIGADSSDNLEAHHANTGKP